MKCPNCNQENEESAMYCRHCGSPMHPTDSKESIISSQLLLIWIIAKAVLVILYKFMDEMDGDSVDFIYTGIEIISDLSNLLPAFAIMNKTLRKIGIFIMSLIVIWWIIQDIMWVIESCMANSHI